MICARWVIPVVPHGACLENHAVVVSDGRIIDVLPTEQAISRFPDIESITLDNHIVTPGLVNAHGHAAMTLLRGYADDIELMEWLEKHIWPVEGRFADADFCYDGTTLAIAEMIRTGTTCGVDTYFFPDATSRAYIDNHFRAQVCLPVVQFANAWASSEDNHIHKALEVHDSVKRQELITTAFAPHAPYTVTDEGFKQIRMYADQLEMPIHLHLHETVTEVESAVSESGMRPFERMAKLGLMSSQLQTIHMTQLTDNEIEQLATKGVHVVHCPESNLKLASGFCQVDKLVMAGVNVCIGTDGAASNNNLDMIEEMRTAAMLSKAVAQDATSISAEDALAMATINAAKMLGLEDEIGSLERGKAADIMAVDMSALNCQPMHHPISQLVYAANGHQVSDVWINGTQVLQNTEFTLLDEAGLRARVDEWRDRINSPSPE
jgi:5-methylthioadenosine/S-adenosylhomocysteine deaminase